MILLENDYSQGAHPEILKKLTQINLEGNSGYGLDKYCESAKSKIRKICDCENADVYFVSGGTQTNQLVIDTMLNQCEGVISAKTGHIALHEAGAIEYSSHKVLTVPSENGKIVISELEKYLNEFNADSSKEHMVQPGLIYISQPTEYGTLYTKSELIKLREICDKFGLSLYADGARFIYSLGTDTDVTVSDMAKYVDVFYIGGTKAGTLFGEAIVFTKNNTPKHFFTRIKQHGALMAKGWLMGCMFDTLFTNDLYIDIANKAIKTSNELRRILSEKGYSFYIESNTNQSFPIVPDCELDSLLEKITYTVWEKYDENHTVLRLATSWATELDEISKLSDVLKNKGEN